MIVQRESDVRHTIGHVFGGPVLMADSSIPVGLVASSTTLTPGKIYVLVANVDTYYAFAADGTTDVTADTGSILLERVPEIRRAPAGKPELLLLGTAAGTVWVSEMEV